MLAVDVFQALRLPMSFAASDGLTLGEFERFFHSFSQAGIIDLNLLNTCMVLSFGQLSEMGWLGGS